MSRRACALAAVALFASACASQPAPDADPAVAAQANRPLAALASQPVALLPAQYLRADAEGLSARLGPAREVLRALDDAIAAELAARGTARSWILPAVLARSAQRNPAFSTDPYALSSESLRSTVRRTNPRLGEPLASQVRGVIALTDARHALVPAELRFERTPEGVDRAVLRLVLIDGRMAAIQRIDEVVTDVTAPNTATIVAALGRRVADLVIEP